MAKLTGYYGVAETVQGIYDKKYYYAIYGDKDCYNVGDKILVSGACNNILTITAILTPEEVKRDLIAEVICRVDFSAYEKRVAEREKKTKLKKELDKKLKELVSENQYEWAAEKDPEFAKMLEEYKKIGE